MENNEWNPQYVYDKLIKEIETIKETLLKLDELITIHPEYKTYLETAKRLSNKQLNIHYDTLHDMASEEY